MLMVMASAPDAPDRVVIASRRRPGPLVRALEGGPAAPALDFGVDTFAFQNDARFLNRGKPDLFASYCFIMARAVRQFLRFARFEPEADRLAAEEVTARVRAVIRRRPWRPALPAAERVVFPGFSGLHDLSRGEEPAVKRAFGTRLWSFVHWTNWRMVHPSWPGQQERVAAACVRELRAGHPVQLLITDFPAVTVDHSVLAFDYRLTPDESVELIVYDPNDPTQPGTIAFDRAARRFRVVHLIGVSPRLLRAFRIYHSPWL